MSGGQHRDDEGMARAGRVNVKRKDVAIARAISFVSVFAFPVPHPRVSAAALGCSYPKKCAVLRYLAGYFRVARHLPTTRKIVSLTPRINLRGPGRLDLSDSWSRGADASRPRPPILDNFLIVRRIREFVRASLACEREHDHLVVIELSFENRRVLIRRRHFSPKTIITSMNCAWYRP